LNGKLFTYQLQLLTDNNHQNLYLFSRVDLMLFRFSFKHQKRCVDKIKIAFEVHLVLRGITLAKTTYVLVLYVYIIMLCFALRHFHLN